MSFLKLVVSLDPLILIVDDGDIINVILRRYRDYIYLECNDNCIVWKDNIKGDSVLGFSLGLGIPSTRMLFGMNVVPAEIASIREYL